MAVYCPLHDKGVKMTGELKEPEEIMLVCPDIGIRVIVMRFYCGAVGLVGRFCKKKCSRCGLRGMLPMSRS